MVSYLVPGVRGVVHGGPFPIKVSLNFSLAFLSHVTSAKYIAISVKRFLVVLDVAPTIASNKDTLVS